jgi:hypothetical protein
MGMVRPWGELAVVSLVLLSGCGSLLPRRDPLCSEIAVFANSIDDDAVHSVELLTDWGGVFSQVPNVFYEKSCQHDQATSSKRLCDYLVNHTSTEFATVNFRRALSCLSRSQSYIGPPDAQVEYLKGAVSSFSVRGAPHSLVTVEFSTGSDDRPPSLKISAQRETAR